MRQKGFALPLIIGLVFSIFILAAVYLKFNEKSKVNQNPQDQVKQQNVTASDKTVATPLPYESPLSLLETSNWKLYSDNYLSLKHPVNFTVKYVPNEEPLGGWIITPNECANNILCSRDGSMVIIQGSSLSSFDSENPSDNFFGDCVRVGGNKSQSVIDSLSAVRVTYTLTAERIVKEYCLKEVEDYQGYLASHFRPKTDYKTEQYFVVVKNQDPYKNPYYRVEISYSSGDKGRSQVLNSIVQTIKFK